MADARHKAELIAAGLELQLGPALEVNHSTGASPLPRARMETLGAIRADAPGEFRPDQLVFRSSIEVRFSLLDAD